MGENPFVAAASKGRRLKLFLWGEQGTGKTTLSLRFPKPIVLDLEGGTKHYTKDFDFAVPEKPPQTADDVVALIDWLLTNQHGFSTLVIDPVTKYWEMLQAKWSSVFLKHNTGSAGHKFEYYDFQAKDWMTIKAEHKEFVRKMLALDMNVIVTARAKTMYSTDKGDFMKPVGITFDAEKGLPYEFDTVVQMYRNADGEYLGDCSKDRTNHIPTGQPFKCTYETFSGLFGDGLSRPSKSTDAWDRDQKPDEPRPGGLASEDHVMAIAQLQSALGTTDETMTKVLAGYGCKAVVELTASQGRHLVERMSKRAAPVAQPAPEGNGGSPAPGPTNDAVEDFEKMYAHTCSRFGVESVDAALKTAFDKTRDQLVGGDIPKAMAVLEEIVST